MAYLGGETTFTCLYAPLSGHIEHIQWIVNEIRVEELEQRDGILVDNVQNVGHLHFINISVEHNDTLIQCRVNLTSGEIINSNNAILFVQGEDIF